MKRTRLLLVSYPKVTRNQTLLVRVLLVLGSGGVFLCVCVCLFVCVCWVLNKVQLVFVLVG